MVFSSVKELGTNLSEIIQVDKTGQLKILDEEKLKKTFIDNLIQEAVFNQNQRVREDCAWYIRNIAYQLNITPASVWGLYQVMGRGEIGEITVPAFNLMGMTYDMARAAFKAACRHRVGALIFEIARSEIDYSYQQPLEYAIAVMAAAIKEGFQGPLFLQGDHFRLNAKRFSQDPKAETQAVKDLIKEAVAADFYNIDIDASTLIDLTQSTLKEQQRRNFELSAELTEYIRGLDPIGLTISIGGEIGEVGGRNSTVGELRIFMDNYLEVLSHLGAVTKGLSKISVQTGTTHGGIPLRDGTVAPVNIDFIALGKLSQAARKRYGLAGVVQHGASTLSEECFDKFPQTGTVEIHLATGFQNILFGSPYFPEELRETVYSYIRKELVKERNPKDTDEQFIYKTRKKILGPFKKDLWNIPTEAKNGLRQELSRKFELFFRKLRVVNTKEIITKYIDPIPALVSVVPSFHSEDS